jgi:hypothetical protein
MDGAQPESSSWTSVIWIATIATRKTTNRPFGRASDQAAKSLVDDLPLLHRELRSLEQEAEMLRETIRQVYEQAAA